MLIETNAENLDSPQHFANVEHALKNASTTQWPSQKQVISDCTFSSNVQTLLDLVNTLPPNIDRAQGANIIKATLQSMSQATGLTVEKILSEAHQNQSDILGTIQKNLQKIDECQNLIKTLEEDIQTKQELASKLFDLIDLFVVPSNTNQSV